MSSTADRVGRDDAVLAVKLWGLATRRYIPTRSSARTDPPEPENLYASLEHDAPVDLLRALARELTALADDWSAHDFEEPTIVPVRACPRRTA